MSQLAFLDLSGNQLIGPIPLYAIGLSSGIIPHCLGNSSNSLSVLNSFHGTFTAAFTKARNSSRVAGLVLRFNRFHGHIDAFKTKSKVPFTKLRIIDICYNEFSGPLLTNYIEKFEAMMNVMGEMYYQDSVVVVMKGFEIEYSRILMVFSIIDLSSNNFQGDISKSIANLNSLRGLNLSHNNLTGHIPTSLVNLTNLESLDLSSNKFVGEIPWQLASLMFLTEPFGQPTSKINSSREAV
ncbi:hypothetical protein ACSBR1_029520 [Camellia fascicularis]